MICDVFYCELNSNGWWYWFVYRCLFFNVVVKCYVSNLIIIIVVYCMFWWVVEYKCVNFNIK